MRRRCSIVTGFALLAGCAVGPPPVAVAPPSAPAPAPARPDAIAAPPAPTPINAGLSPAATLWHLRAGLNVAALACRGAGEAETVARYNALLARRAAVLKVAEAAYQAEYRSGGGDWRDRYDDDQTRLYNFFGQARGRADLCAAAAATLAALDAVDDAALATVAGDRLAALDRAFAPPRLEVDARVFAGPGMVMVASR